MWIPLMWIVVVTVLVAAVVVLAFGRGEGLPDQEPDDVIVQLPQGRPMVASDVETLRLPIALRGYRMAAVDEVLDRLAAEIALRDAQISELQRER